jgi:hypothetical protein
MGLTCSLDGEQNGCQVNLGETGLFDGREMGRKKLKCILEK